MELGDHSRLEALEGSSAHLNRTLEGRTRALENMSKTIAGIGACLERLERRIGGKEREREHRRSNDKEPWSHASRRGHGRDERESSAGSLWANRREELDHERLRRRGGRVEARRKEVERWLEEEGPSISKRGSKPKEDLYVRRPMGQRNYREGKRRDEEDDEGLARGPSHQVREPRSTKIELPKFGGGSYEWRDEVKQYLDACKVIMEGSMASKSLPPKEPWKEEEETSGAPKEEEEKNEERPLCVEEPSSEELQDEAEEKPCLEWSSKGSPDHQCIPGQASLPEMASEEEVAMGATEEKGGEDQDYGADLSPSGDASCFALVMTEHQEGKEEATTKAPPPPPYMTPEDKGRFQGRGDVEDPAPPLIYIYSPPFCHHQ